MAGMIGVGNLALPYTFKQCGILIGVSFVTVSAVMGTIASSWLMKSAFKRDKSKYSDLIYDVCGDVSNRKFKY